MSSRPIFATKSAAVLALSPMPLLALGLGEFKGHSDYAFAALALPAAAVLGWTRLRRTIAFWPGRPKVGRGFVIAAGLILLGAAAVASPWGAALALLLIGAAFAWDMGGWPAIRAIIPSLLLLAICIPLPLDLDRTAVVVMARWAARWASHFLDLLGVAHVRSDQVLVFAGGRLDMTGLLGGPFSPFALAASLLVLAIGSGRNWWRSVIIVITGLAFLPVVTAATAAGRMDWASGGGPDFLWAAANLAVAAGLAFSFDQLVGIPSALALKPPAPPAEAVPTAPAGPIAGGGSVGRFAAAIFAGLAVLQVWAIAAHAPGAPTAPADWLPDRIGDWIAIPETEIDRNGLSREYRNGDRRVGLRIIPAREVAGPVADLELNGWVVRWSAVLQDDPTAVRAHLELPAERFATVCVSGLMVDGRRVAPSMPLIGPGARARAALGRPFGGGSNRRADWWVRSMSVTILPASAQETADPADLLHVACELLARRLRPEGGP
jgi:hypothetical protein